MFSRSHICQQQYIEFRFEDWLRKYQPAPRKRVKQHCKHCLRKSAQFSKQNRMSRLCETRKNYLLASRERASEYSRKKEALQNAQNDRQNRVVSDFICESELIQSNFVLDDEVNQINNNRINYCFQNKQILRSQNQERQQDQLIFKETPFKMGIQQRICKQTDQIYQQMQMTSHQKKQKIIKDIDFHIQMVEQLHSKIIQQNYNSQQKKQQQIQLSIFDNVFEIKSQMIDEQQQCQSKQFQEQDLNKISLSKQPQMNQQNQDQYKYQAQNHVKNQFKTKTYKNCFKQHFVKKQVHCKPNRRKTNIQLDQPIPSGGRLKINGQQHECYLSARVLYKLCTTHTDDPQKVKIKLMKRHPYLGDPSNFIQQLLQNNCNTIEQINANNDKSIAKCANEKIEQLNYN